MVHLKRNICDTRVLITILCQGLDESLIVFIKSFDKEGRGKVVWWEERSIQISIRKEKKKKLTGHVHLDGNCGSVNRLVICKLLVRGSEIEILAKVFRNGYVPPNGTLLDKVETFFWRINSPLKIQVSKERISKKQANLTNHYDTFFG